MHQRFYRLATSVLLFMVHVFGVGAAHFRGRLPLVLLGGAALLLALLPTAPPARAAITVNESGDAPGDCPAQCALRAAIAGAGPADKITFAPGLASPIVLTQGPLTISKNFLEIAGPGANSLAVDGRFRSRVFVITGQSVIISGLTLRAGSTDEFDEGGAAVLNNGDLTLLDVTISRNDARFGGGIRNNRGASLTLRRSTVSDNLAGVGGGIQNDGSLTLDASTVSGNSTFDGAGSTRGGGILNTDTGTATLTNCIVSDNRTGAAVATSVGGGIQNDTGGRMTLINSTVRDNFTSAATSRSIGGGINNDGTLTLTNSTVSGNSTRASFDTRGGGILNAGTLTLTNSTVTGNSNVFITTTGGGAGITNFGTATLTNSTVRDNLAAGVSFDTRGGGIRNSGTLTLTNSTVSDNQAPIGHGAGIRNDNGGTATLTNVTVSGNDLGGAIDNGGTATLTNVTVSFNSEVGIRNSGTLRLHSSILDNVANCTGNAIESLGNNLSNTDNCFRAGQNGDLVADPGLDLALKHNGGPTLTQALLPGSPAIDGVTLNPTDCPRTDQRGVPRPQGLRCDIGAFELESLGIGSVPTLLRSAGSASRVGTVPSRGRDGRAQVRIAERFAFEGTVELNGSTVTVESVLDEVDGAGELVRGRGGAPLLPVVLAARPGGRPDAATFESPSGAIPRVRVELRARGSGLIDLVLKVDRASIPTFPSLCAGDGVPRTTLATSLTIDDGVNPPVPLFALQAWRCLHLIGGDPGSPRSLRVP